MRQFNRADRIGQQLLREVSTLVSEEMSEGLPGLLTFTHVKVSKDLMYATVYYSILGDEDKRSAAKEWLERNHKQIRFELGRRLHVRRMPELTFKFDPSIEEGIRIEQLLNEVKDKSSGSND